MSKSRGRTARKRSRIKKLFVTESSGCGDYGELMRWLSKSGFKCKNLRPKVFPDSGRGLMATQDICSGDTFIKITENLIINPQRVLSGYLGPFFERYCSHASGVQILSVFLMYEMLKGKQSFWHHYLNTLPSTYTIPAYFSQNILSLFPVSLFKQVMKQLKNLNESFKELTVLFHALENEESSFKNKFSFEFYRWAWCSVNSRCVYIDCWPNKSDCKEKNCTYHLALVPFLDLLNHSCHVEVQAGFNEKSKNFEIKSLCAFKKYSQVFINYGCHDNRTLFLEYGFVIPDNVHDSVPILEEDVLSAMNYCTNSTNHLERIRFIQQKNLTNNMLCTHEEISWNLTTVLKVFSVKEDLMLWELILHQDYSLNDADRINFTNIKQHLLLLKLQEYTNLHTIMSKNESCYLNLIFELFRIEKCILKGLLK